MAEAIAARCSRAWRRLRGRPSPGAGADPPADLPVAEPPAFLVDAATRTWWRPGDPRSETLVEAVAARDPEARLARRVAALVAGGAGSGTYRPGRAPGTSDPTFCELLSVELLRAGRFDRAFALLAPECQESWGSVSAYAAGTAAVARALGGARVVAVELLDTWEDAQAGRTWAGACELDVEYALRSPAGGTRVVRRAVHLVQVDGRWRTLHYAPAAATPAVAGDSPA